MDIMQIKSKLLTGIISRIINRQVRKNLGIDPKIKLNNVDIINENGVMKMHLDIDAEVFVKDIESLI